MKRLPSCGVHKASFYDPEINRSYAMMAAHYGAGILPAEPYRLCDMAKVEADVRGFPDGRPRVGFHLCGRLEFAHTVACEVSPR